MGEQRDNSGFWCYYVEPVPKTGVSENGYFRRRWNRDLEASGGSPNMGWRCFV